MGTPALLAAQSSKIISAINQSSAALYRKCDLWGLAADGSTAPAAAASVVTASLSYAAGVVVMPSGTAYETAAVTDDVFNAAAEQKTLAFGTLNDAVAAYVFDASSGALVATQVWGDAAASGDAVAPTDAEIVVALGHTEFVRIADALYALGSASAVAATWDNTARSGFANIAAGINGGLATTETGWNSSLSS